MPELPRVIDLGDDHVLVDGRRVWGSIHRIDGECGHQQIYSERYDAFLCPVENKWNEKGCSDASCQFCGSRPAHPFDVNLDGP